MSARSVEERRGSRSAERAALGGINMVTKILRMIRHRWWIIAAVALIGAAAGIYFAQARNARINPRIQATGTLALEGPTSSSNSRNPEPSDTSSLDAALELAESVNADFIEAKTGGVLLDTRVNTLIFSALDRNEASAVSRVETMRSRWLEATREQLLEERAARLDAIVVEANDILSQIDALTPEDPVEETVEVPDDIVERFLYLDNVLGALEPMLDSLEIDRVLSELGEPQLDPVDEIDEKIEAFSARISEIRTEMLGLSDEWGLVSARLEDPLPTAPATPSEPEPQVVETGGQGGGTTVIPPTSDELEVQWQLDALAGQYAELGVEFEDLFAQGDDVTLPEAGEVEVEDLTPARASFPAYGAIGALFGALLALGAVFGLARLQRRTYTADDLSPVPVFAEIPALASRRTEPVAIPPSRLEGVKTIRNNLITLIKSSDRTPAIGLTRVAIDQRHVRELAIDLGRRLAASDLRVLVLDLDLDAAPTQSDLSQYHSMTEFWSEIRRDPEAGADLLQRILSDRFETAPTTMCVIMAGAAQGDSDDIVLTRSFGIFLDVCRQEADIILAVAPDSAATATHSLMQALDGVIAVAGVGVSTRNQVVDLASVAQAGGSRLLGTTLLTGTPRDSQPRFGGISADGHDEDLPEISDSEAVDFTAVDQNGANLEQEFDGFAESVASREPPS